MTEWLRTRKDRRCPVCQRPDWCMVNTDGVAVICARVGEGAIRHLGEAGWLHRLGDGARKVMSFERRKPLYEIKIDAPAIADKCAQAIGEEGREMLSSDLGVGVNSLRRLSAGWSEDWRSYTFPMRDENEEIIGIRLRNAKGEKFAIRGSRSGCFIPTGMSGDGDLIICEGPTDTAALLDRGFDVIGRPSNTGGAQILSYWCRDNARRRNVVILSDRDRPGSTADSLTRFGAATLAAELVPCVRSVRIIQPPVGCKDARDWATSGASHAEIQCVISSAHYVVLGSCPRQPVRSLVHN
jgi:hypothetical protein